MPVNWFAVTTKPNLEKSATAALEGKGLEAFLPFYRVRRRWSDRTKELMLPLFPGYSFCRLDPSHRGLVLTTPGTTGIVRFGDKFAPIPDEQIEAVRQTVNSGLAVQPWPFLRTGQRVAVVSGPLTGVEGIVTELKKEYRLVVSIEMLQRSMAVEISHDWVKTI
jgi:transcription antitermination factor NusG